LAKIKLYRTRDVVKHRRKKAREKALLEGYELKPRKRR
jgi:hypothetical protein